MTVEAEDVVVAAAHVDADSPRSGTTRSATADAAADAAQRGAGGAVRVGRGGRAARLPVFHQHRHGDPPRRRLQGEL